MGEQLSLRSDPTRFAILTDPISKGSTPLLETMGSDPSPWRLRSADGSRRYRIEHGIPVLLAPEGVGEESGIGRGEERYREAYEEMEHYNAIGSAEATDIRNAIGFRLIRPVLDRLPDVRDSFPEPWRVWLDATYDCASQWDAYRYIAPAVGGGRVLQLGGKGIHVIKMLLAGAREGWLATPMIGEAMSALMLADVAGVAERLVCITAVAEELPFASHSFDAIYAGGSVHHMVTDLAFPECARVLRTGGRFAAVDPWRAPLYSVGTWLLGKREVGVKCRPLDKSRVRSLAESFPQSTVTLHGTLTRYGLLAAWKAGVEVSLGFARACFRMDDAISNIIPGLRGLGSSVVLMAQK